jgi:hypothetical protein
MQINTCRYVNLSDLFAGCPIITQAFAEADHDFTWGGNNLTMVTVEAVHSAVMSLVPDTVAGTQEYLQVLQPRIWSIENDTVYVNLEA